jgi:hypothetical protein
MICDFCNKDIKNEFLKKIIIDDGEKAFVCDECKENFFDINILSFERRNSE